MEKENNYKIEKMSSNIRSRAKPKPELKPTIAIFNKKQNIGSVMDFWPLLITFVDQVARLPGVNVELLYSDVDAILGRIHTALQDSDVIENKRKEPRVHLSYTPKMLRILDSLEKEYRKECELANVEHVNNSVTIFMQRIKLAVEREQRNYRPDSSVRKMIYDRNVFVGKNNPSKRRHVMTRILPKETQTKVKGGKSE